jgi:hypothetical protein
VLGDDQFSNYSILPIPVASTSVASTNFSKSLLPSIPTFKTEAEIAKEKETQAVLDASWLKRESTTTQTKRDAAGVTAMDKQVADSLQGFLNWQKSKPATTSNEQPTTNNQQQAMDNQQQTTNDTPQPTKDNTMLWVGAILGVIVIGGGIFYFTSNSEATVEV